LFCLAYSLANWFLLFRHEPHTFQRKTDSHVASQLAHGHASRRFFPLMCRRAALLEKTEPGLLCCPSSEVWTNHPWPCSSLRRNCSTGWSRRLRIPWYSTWRGSHARLTPLV
jgi:hypothetical protein